MPRLDQVAAAIHPRVDECADFAVSGSIRNKAALRCAMTQTEPYAHSSAPGAPGVGSVCDGSRSSGGSIGDVDGVPGRGLTEGGLGADALGEDGASLPRRWGDDASPAT
jgi:hypothetical protein